MSSDRRLLLSFLDPYFPKELCHLILQYVQHEDLGLVLKRTYRTSFQHQARQNFEKQVQEYRMQEPDLYDRVQRFIIDRKQGWMTDVKDGYTRVSYRMTTLIEQFHLTVQLHYNLPDEYNDFYNTKIEDLLPQWRMVRMFMLEHGLHLYCPIVHQNNDYHTKLHEKRFNIDIDNFDDCFHNTGSCPYINIGILHLKGYRNRNYQYQLIPESCPNVDERSPPNIFFNSNIIEKEDHESRKPLIRVLIEQEKELGFLI